VGANRRNIVPRSLLPGVLDVGFSSIATFAVGIYAARSLGTADFGVYALFNSAFIFAAVVPTYLLLSPAAFATLSSTSVERERLNVLRQTSRLAPPLGLLAGTLASVVASVSAAAPARIVAPLALTSVVCSMVSPLQDHVRRTLHMASRSWFATVVSLVQLMGVGASLVVLTVVGLAEPWRPFTALALANTVSLSVGIALARREASGSLPRFAIRPLARSGGWLLISHVSMAGGFFASTAIVTAVAGRGAVGQAEAARLVAQPLFVLATALDSITWHLSMAAGERRDAAAAHRVARLFLGVLVLGGLMFALVTATPWWGNPLARLLPEAYAVPGLALVSIGAFVVHASFLPFAYELYGAGRRRVHSLAPVFGGLIQCAAALTAVWLGAFARPLAFGALSAAILMIYLPNRRRIYRAGRQAGVAPSAHPASEDLPTGGDGACDQTTELQRVGPRSPSSEVG